MKQILSWKKLPLLLLASGLVITVAFAQSNSGRQKHSLSDTLPTKQKKIKDLDEALAEIDRGEIEMQKSLKELDRDKIEVDIRKAMKAVEIDMVKMKEDVDKAMKEVDMQKINLDVQKAIKEVNTEKIKQDVADALAKVDMEEIKAELQKVKEIDLKKVQVELANIQPEIEKAMKEAKVGMEKAKKEITSYKNLVNDLDRDVLLDKKENYTVEYKNKQLTVNGKKLSVEETKKYSEYLSDKKEFTLEKNSDGIEIDN